MIIKIKSHSYHHLAYNVFPGKAHFYRFSSELPINVFVLNEKNFNNHKNKNPANALLEDLSETLKYRRFLLPKDFKGHSLYYVLENISNKEITVSFDAGK